MDEPLEGVEPNAGVPEPAAIDAAARSGGRPALRAAQLWKLLGDEGSSKARPAPDPTPPPLGEPETPSKSWAGDELGELLARAWYETVEGETPAPAAASTADEWSQPAAWEVDRLPSASEGGVAALFGGAPRAQPPLASPPALSDITQAHGQAEPDETEPAPAREKGMGRALLAEMIEQLPDEPAPRVTPADIHIETPVVAPVAIWFWGDDDIYPGRVASTGTPPAVTANKKTKKSRTAIKPEARPNPASPKRKAFTLTRKSRSSTD